MEEEVTAVETALGNYYLQQFSDRSNLAVTVCHYPPGTSKWNKIEHRMFSLISLNWQGQPLVSYETVVNLIGKAESNDSGPQRRTPRSRRLRVPGRPARPILSEQRRQDRTS